MVNEADFSIAAKFVLRPPTFRPQVLKVVSLKSFSAFSQITPAIKDDTHFTSQAMVASVQK